MRMIGIIRIAMGTDMIELLDRDRAILLDGGGDFPEMRNDAVVAGAEIAACQHCRRMHRHWFDDYHGSTANRPLSIVGDMLAVRHAILCHVGRVCAEDDPVTQRLLTQLHRGKEVREEFRHQGSWVASETNVGSLQLTEKLQNSKETKCNI